MNTFLKILAAIMAFTANASTVWPFIKWLWDEISDFTVRFWDNGLTIFDDMAAPFLPFVFIA